MADAHLGGAAMIAGPAIPQAGVAGFKRPRNTSKNVTRRTIAADALRGRSRSRGAPVDRPRGRSRSRSRGAPPFRTAEEAVRSPRAATLAPSRGRSLARAATVARAMSAAPPASTRTLGAPATKKFLPTAPPFDCEAKFVKGWTRTDEQNFRMADTIHDFEDATRAFAVSRLEDKYGRRQIIHLMNTYVRDPPIRSAEYGMGKDTGGDLEYIRKSHVEHDIVDFYEEKYPELFHREGRGANAANYIIRVSDLAKDREYHKQMYHMIYEIEEDVDSEELNDPQQANIANNLKEWLGFGDAKAVLCDGPPQSFIKWLLDKNKYMYAYTWVSQYDSAGVIGKEKKADARAIKYIPEQFSTSSVDLTCVMNLTRFHKDTEVAEPVIGIGQLVPVGAAPPNRHYQITLKGGLWGAEGKSYKATQNRGLSVSELTMLIKLTEILKPDEPFLVEQLDNYFERYINARSVRDALKNYDIQQESERVYSIVKTIQANPMNVLFEGSNAEEVIRKALDIKYSGDGGQIEFGNEHRKDIAFNYSGDTLFAFHARTRQESVALASKSETSERAIQFFKGRPAQTPLERLAYEVSQYILLVEPIAHFCDKLLHRRGDLNTLFANTKRAYDENELLKTNTYLKYMILQKIKDTENFVRGLIARAGNPADITMVLDTFINLKRDLNSTNMTLESLSHIKRLIQETFENADFQYINGVLQNIGFSRYVTPLSGPFEFDSVRFLENNCITTNGFFNYNVDLDTTCAIITDIISNPLQFRRGTLGSKIEEVKQKLAVYADSFYAKVKPTFTIYQFGGRATFDPDIAAEALTYEPINMIGGSRAKVNGDDKFRSALIGVLKTSVALYKKLAKYDTVLEFVGKLPVTHKTRVIESPVKPVHTRAIVRNTLRSIKKLPSRRTLRYNAVTSTLLRPTATQTMAAQAAGALALPPMPRDTHERAANARLKAICKRSTSDLLKKIFQIMSTLKHVKGKELAYGSNDSVRVVYSDEDKYIHDIRNGEIEQLLHDYTIPLVCRVEKLRLRDATNLEIINKLKYIYFNTDAENKEKALKDIIGKIKLRVTGLPDTFVKDDFIGILKKSKYTQRKPRRTQRKPILRPLSLPDSVQMGPLIGPVAKRNSNKEIYDDSPPRISRSNDDDL